MTLEPGTVVGGYVVEGVLGRGGMATVYSARHGEHGRRVALKVLAGDRYDDPEFIARFRREGRLQASIEHPHVVTVFEAGESEHGLFLAMRLVLGVDARDADARTRARRTARGGPPAPGRRGPGRGARGRARSPRREASERARGRLRRRLPRRLRADDAGRSGRCDGHRQAAGDDLLPRPRGRPRRGRRPGFGPLRVRRDGLRMPYRHGGLPTPHRGRDPLRAHQRAAAPSQPATARAPARARPGLRASALEGSRGAARKRRRPRRRDRRDTRQRRARGPGPAASSWRRRARGADRGAASR